MISLRRFIFYVIGEWKHLGRVISLVAVTDLYLCRIGRDIIPLNIKVKLSIQNIL